MTIEKKQIKLIKDRHGKPLAEWANPPGDGAEMYADDVRNLAKVFTSLAALLDD